MKKIIGLFLIMLLVFAGCSAHNRVERVEQENDPRLLYVEQRPDESAEAFYIRATYAKDIIAVNYEILDAFLLEPITVTFWGAVIIYKKRVVRQPATEKK